MSTTKRGPFTVKSSKEVYKNPWIRLREDSVVRPDGNDGIFGIVEMIAGSSILPVDENGFVYLAKEYKYAVGKYSTEVFSGGLENNENPLDGAKRELEEELGVTAQEWIPLGIVDPFTTVVSSQNYLFLARNLSTGVKKLDEGEKIHTVRVSYKEALDMVMKGEITHAASCVLILKAKQFLQPR